MGPSGSSRTRSIWRPGAPWARGTEVRSSVPTLIEETTPARPRVSRAIGRSGLVLVALIAPACGPSTSPSADAARTALATALDAWRDGKKPADLAGLTPPVQ